MVTKARHSESTVIFDEEVVFKPKTVMVSIEWKILKVAQQEKIRAFSILKCSKFGHSNYDTAFFPKTNSNMTIQRRTYLAAFAYYGSVSISACNNIAAVVS